MIQEKLLRKRRNDFLNRSKKSSKKQTNRPQPHLCIHKTKQVNKTKSINKKRHHEKLRTRLKRNRLLDANCKVQNNRTRIKQLRR